MTIAFIHPHIAFLPEIAAYRAFFERYGVLTKVVTLPEAASLQVEVEWYFMGRGGKKKNTSITIHEYPSASTPPLALLKNCIKRITAPTPAFRLFQNEYVRDIFRFRDDIPFGIRRHAVGPAPLAPSGTMVKTYDFIYSGTVDKARRLDPLFEHFVSGSLKDRTLLVLSRDYQELKKALEFSPNIHFKGPVPPAEVPGYILQARYALNFIPDQQPFNRQPSGKFLDYVACRTPVITTDYQWIRDFQAEKGGNYYYLLPDLSNFLWDPIIHFDYRFPDLTGWTWDEQIRQSGVLQFLLSKFPDLRF